ncbi:MAG: hypothetical protein JWR22_2978 [Herminiimonas sp.]|nr:hypothetical protein [Herminiimonas sp.]
MSFLKAVGGLAAGATVIASALAVSVVLATQGYDLTDYHDVSIVPMEVASPADDAGTALTKGGSAMGWSEEWSDVQKSIPSSGAEARPAETF